MLMTPALMSLHLIPEMPILCSQALQSPVAPRIESGRRPSADESHLAVIDREGRALFETQGMMADWMPAWPEGTAR